MYGLHFKKRFLKNSRDEIERNSTSEAQTGSMRKFK